MKPEKTISFDLNDPIFTVCRTTWERRRLVEEFQMIENKLYTVENQDVAMIVKEICRLSTYEIVNRVVGNEADKYQLRLRTIRQALMTIPEMEISLAIEPTVQMIQRIWNKITQFTQKPLILDLHYEPILIAGATVQYQGQYRDYSLRQKLEVLIQSIA